MHQTLEYIKVTVTPGAKHEKILQGPRGRYEIHVKERAEENQANLRAQELVAQLHGISPKMVRLVNGHKRPQKIFTIIR